VVPGAITADPLGVLAAFGAGILSFISPCVLPLVPGYLSLVSGLSAAELGTPKGPRATRRGRAAMPPGARVGGAGEQVVATRELAFVGAAGPGATVAPPGAASSGPPEAPVPPRPARRPLAPLLRGILLFVAGFTVVFVALGATASGVHALLAHHKQALDLTSGALIVVLGVMLLVTSLPARAWALLGPRVAGRIGWLLGERRIRVRPETFGAWAAPVMGMAFAFAWTPCIGPVLGAVLALTFRHATLGGGVLLLFAYSLGLGVPFLVTGIAFDRLTGFYARARKPLAVVQVVAGAVLVAFGAILLAGDLGWLSAQFTSLLDHLGLQRLTES
jgi:cytochrome c-type biogenesis protein